MQGAITRQFIGNASRNKLHPSFHKNNLFYDGEMRLQIIVKEVQF